VGYSDSEIAALGTGGAGALEIRAPFRGEIVARRVVTGEVVEEGATLFTLTDRSTLWVMLNIPESSLPFIHEGQTVHFSPDALPDRAFDGTLTWVSARLDDRTRMLPARAELKHPPEILRAGMFGRARILTGQADHSLVVPESALQTVGGHELVFVRLADDLYEARAVTVGMETAGRIEILDGLLPDEEVVVTGSFVAKSQLLLSRLGAGCVD
jgi:RND family efflux transporter MFP subunit